VKGLKLPPKPKDKHAPKQPRSAYMMFQEEERKRLCEIDEKYKHTSMIEINRILVSKWNSLSDEEKKRYDVILENAKNKFTEEMRAYQQTKEYKEHRAKLDAWELANKQNQEKIKNNENNNNNDDHSNNHKKNTTNTAKNQKPKNGH